ncbi:MAG: putative serine protease PepD [Acidobacteriota bacterium]|jgi:S1-C subfamily serine protease|nr:putative serine protease PepD [Acidobacteriota bacterium]
MMPVIVLIMALAGASPRAASPGWLGMQYTWSAPSKSGHRVLNVRSVAPDGPSDRAGVRAGDIVTTMNGRSVDFGDELELLLFLGEQRAGDHLTLGVVREGRSLKLDIILGTMSPQALAARRQNLEAARRARLAATAPSAPAP